MRFRSRTLCLTVPLMVFLLSCGEPSPRNAQTSEDQSGQTETLGLYPENPRYFQYGDDPLFLITSAEHYGALLNLDFDFQQYLETLCREGFNYTRIFTGTYYEPVDNVFGIRKNTLAPLPGRYISPWAPVGEKYDLDRFNPAYFDRLKAFMSAARDCGIIVEVTLFSSIYAENAWKLSPLHPENNINATGTADRYRVHTLYNGDLLEYQERFIRKMVRELNGFGNFFFEIQNEPWADHPNLAAWVNEDDTLVFTRPWQKEVVLANRASMDWQQWVTGVIRDEESSLPNTHLIAQNICNFGHPVEEVPEGISVLNFHYARPEAAGENLEAGVVPGLDETGFMPHEDRHYVDQAWRFMLAGGGLYNNLDYSFTAGNETGSWPIPDSNPGWGGPVFREKLALLASTLQKVPFHRMEPVSDVAEAVEGEIVQHGLGRGGEAYLLFLEHISGKGITLRIPEGAYRLNWIDVDTGREEEQIMERIGGISLSPPFENDRVALMIRKE